MKYPIEQIRSDFPILSRLVNKKPLVYLDNAASSQKPNVVIDCESNYYRYGCAAVHRGTHTLSREATENVENVRKQIAKFINANSEEEIIFVRGATEAINLVAYSWGWDHLQPGDSILITEMEHHSNIVPWIMLAEKKRLSLKYIPLLPDGTLDISNLSSLLNERVKLFAITQISNVLGTNNLLSVLIKQVKKIKNVVILVDGAQGIVHHKVDVQSLNCDFYVFSGHKLYGPSGIGILYAKKDLLNIMSPWEGGGSMIHTVSLTQGITFNKIPWRFEAGSIHTAGILGLGAAIHYIEKIGMHNIQIYEQYLMDYMLCEFKKISNCILYGPSDRIGILAFNLENYHAYDIGSLLDQHGIAIRTGHHCAIPLMSYFKVSSMCRVSIAMYTNQQDIDQLILSIIRIQQLLS